MTSAMPFTAVAPSPLSNAIAITPSNGKKMTIESNKETSVLMVIGYRLSVIG